MNILGIKETCLYFSELEKARDFYNGLLGFPVIGFAESHHIFFRVGRSVLLCFDPESSRLKKSPPAHYGHGALHLAFEVAKTEYDLWKQKIPDMNIEIIDEIEWKNGLRSFYFLDPEGNVLEIVPEGVWDQT